MAKSENLIRLLIQALGNPGMESRVRQQLATCNSAASIFPSLSQCRPWDLIPSMKAERSTDPVQDRPPRQSRRPRRGLPITSVEARLHQPKARVGLSGSSLLSSPAKDKQASNGRRVPLQLSSRQPCTSPTGTLLQEGHGGQPGRQCWFRATPVLKTSIYPIKQNRD